MSKCGDGGHSVATSFILKMLSEIALQGDDYENNI